MWVTGAQTSSSSVASSGIVANAVSRYASGEITTDRQAAHFLRQATLGPTLTEIARVRAAGSRQQWLQQQISRCFGGYDQFSEWDANGLAQPGWFGTVTLSMRPPYAAPWQAKWPFLGSTQRRRFLTTALLRNAPNDPAAVIAAHPSGTLYSADKSFLCKVVWVLSKFIVASVPGGAWDAPDKIWSIMGWYSMLGRMAFMNYVDFLEEVTYSVAMSRMLTYYGNQKASGLSKPDENYAREIMQLFTIGLYEMNMDGSYKLNGQGNPIPTYDNRDIEELARVFTGLTMWAQSDVFYTTDSPANRTTATTANLTQEALSYTESRTYEGVVYPAGVMPRLRWYVPFWENGPVYALGGRIDFPSVEASQANAKERLRKTIEALVAHPNTGPFVALNLIQHTVTSNPSPDYIRRVAEVFADNGAGVTGDMAAVWMAILCDPEAENTVHTNPMHGRVRDGFDLYANHVRSFDRTGITTTDASDSNDTLFVNEVAQPVGSTNFVAPPDAPSTYGTWPLYSPSIFGHYDRLFEAPDLRINTLNQLETSPVPPDTVLPELGSMPANVLATILNGLDSLVNSNEPRDSGTHDTVKCLNYETALGAGILTAPSTTVLEVLNLLLCGGSLSADKITRLNTVLSSMPTSTDTERQNRIAVALQLINRCHEFWVQ